MTTEKIIIEVIGHDKASGPLKGVGSALGGIGTIMGGILSAQLFSRIAGGIYSIGKESILAAARVNELRAVNEILAGNAGIGIDIIESEADEIRSMGITAATAQKTVAEFIKNQLDLSKASDIARIAQDAAVISQTDSSEALERIKNGIITLNTETLRNAGIIVDSQAQYKKLAKELHTTISNLTTAQKQQAFLNGVMKAGDSIAGAYAAAMNQPGKVLRSFPRYFNDIAVAIGDVFQPAFSEVVFTLADFVKKIPDAIENIKKLGLKEVLPDQLMEILLRFGDWWDEYGPNISWSAKMIGDAIKESFGEIGADAGPFLLEMLNNLANWFNDNGPLIVRYIRTIANLWVNNLAPAIVSAWGIIKPLITALTIELGGLVKASMQLVTGDFSGAFETMKNTLIRVVPQIISVLDGFMDTIATIIYGEGKWDEIKETWAGNWELLTIIIEKVAEKIKAKANKFMEVGKAIVLGIKIGIMGAWSAFVSWLIKKLNSVIDVVKTALGIQSPSKVFAEIGENLTKGLAQGISRGIGLPMVAVSTMAPAMQQAAVTGAITNRHNYYGPVSFGSPGSAMDTLNEYIGY